MNVSKYIEKGYSYSEYYSMLENLLAEGKSTGPNQSEDMLGYSKLNFSRMKRLNKTTKLEEETKQVLKQVNTKISFVVLSEGWCGDAAQNLPVIQKMIEENDQLSLSIVLRDDNLNLMDEYLTNGGRSIPKLIAIDSNGNELFVWGPRPDPVQQMVMDNKANPVMPYSEFSAEIQKWYNNDKTKTVQSEFVKLIQSI